MQTLIYSSAVDSEEDLLACFVEAATTMRQETGIF
jgi:hypothetical protein